MIKKLGFEKLLLKFCTNQILTFLIIQVMKKIIILKILLISNVIYCIRGVGNGYTVCSCFPLF